MLIRHRPFGVKLMSKFTAYCSGMPVVALAGPGLRNNVGCALRTRTDSNPCYGYASCPRAVLAVPNTASARVIQARNEV